MWDIFQTWAWISIPIPLMFGKHCSHWQIKLHRCPGKNDLNLPISSQLTAQNSVVSGTWRWFSLTVWTCRPSYCTAWIQHPVNRPVSSVCALRLASTVNTAGSRWWTSELGCSISPSTATSSSALTVATWTIILLNRSPPTKYLRLIDKCCSCTLVKVLLFQCCCFFF